MTSAAAVPMPAPDTRRPPPAAWMFLLIGLLGMAAAWMVLNLWNGRSNGWMAAVAALDMAWMLRLGRWPAGGARAGVAMASTLAIAVAVNWGVAASHLGRFFGLDPLESALRLGAHHAWTLIGLANGPWDAAWLLLGLVLAWRFAR